MNPLPSLDVALLAQLQRFVSRVLAEVAEHQQALTAESVSVDPGWRQRLRACEPRVAGLTANADRAAAKHREVDQTLAKGEDELRRFLTVAADFRHSLANGSQHP